MKTILKIGIVVAMTFSLLGSFYVGWNFASPIAYNDGLITGYETGLKDVSGFLRKQGTILNWTQNQNGTYTLTLTGADGTFLNAYVELHCITEHRRNGVLLSYENHAMSLTNYGKNWIADNLCGALLTNVSLIASYISTSNQSAAFDATWTAVPTEHLEGSTGLGRANSTYTDTGTGLFNLTHTFTSKGTYSTQTYFLSVDSYANWPDGGGIAGEVQASAKNMVALDTLAVTIMGTIS